MDSRMVLLYGVLHVDIHEASGLPNMDSFSENLRQCVTICRPCINTVSNVDLENRINSDPYVCVVLKGATVARTRVISNTSNPKWEEHFEIHVAHTVSDVVFLVKDNDTMGAQLIGKIEIPAKSLLTNEIRHQSYTLEGSNKEPRNSTMCLTISAKYISVGESPSYKNGICAGPEYNGIPKTYFPLRKGGRVTLYQDAHVPDGSLLPIPLKGGLNFQQGKCWEDICQAIVDARHLVYVAGWSIYAKTRLVRTDVAEGNNSLLQKSLGELLKAKADHGTARVLLLVWDDKTSHSLIGNVGVMGTHDEETRRFFKHSNVKCLLAPRYGARKSSWFKQKMVGTLYTHHQKIVIVDAAGPENKRRLIAFLGGLDLCDGRYDTPEHTLFKNLNSVFVDDYRNPTFTSTAESGGPRQPWHDLHCKIEGPAVYDVLTNFEQRWRKAAKWHAFRLKFTKYIHWHNNNLLVDIKQLPWIIDPSKGNDCQVTEGGDPETWHVQIFRSIDSGSAKGFPKDVKLISEQNLVGGKNIAVDMSIHTAYVTAIRSAQHFIYIENQYFLGSSFAWPQSQDAGANHLVPIELALKIVSKIKASEKFAVYVVIPMWPEGVPSSSSVQEILYFQTQTMEMMYTLIARALREMGLEKEYRPTDYLNFFCLGKREAEVELSPSNLLDEKTVQVQVQKKRRFMIYVHAKGMIVDDEYVILGSANINQRSMAGSRDTEIAMGAYQPHNTWAYNNGSSPQGQVYGYRRSLWYEHLGVEEECFKKPWSVECVRKVRSLAEINWEDYASDKLKQLQGHLLLYPVNVQSSGKVVSLTDHETFPDVGGMVLGSQTRLPDSLTS